ncbi:MAG: hypothetical protein QJR00_04070, partial [Bacillota bacterium]|nr:hypothetical protein [Bacillota bacterium]
YEELEEGPWYENRAQLLVPDIPAKRSLSIARDTAFYLYHRRLSQKEAGRFRRGSGRRSR